MVTAEEEATCGQGLVLAQVTPQQATGVSLPGNLSFLCRPSPVPQKKGKRKNQRGSDREGTQETGNEGSKRTIRPPAPLCSVTR